MPFAFICSDPGTIWCVMKLSLAAVFSIIIAFTTVFATPEPSSANLSRLCENYDQSDYRLFKQELAPLYSGCIYYTRNKNGKFNVNGIVLDRKLVVSTAQVINNEAFNSWKSGIGEWINIAFEDRANCDKNFLENIDKSTKEGAIQAWLGMCFPVDTSAIKSNASESRILQRTIEILDSMGDQKRSVIRINKEEDYGMAPILPHLLREQITQNSPYPLWENDSITLMLQDPIAHGYLLKLLAVIAQDSVTKIQLLLRVAPNINNSPTLMKSLIEAIVATSKPDDPSVALRLDVIGKELIKKLVTRSLAPKPIQERLVNYLVGDTLVVEELVTKYSDTTGRERVSTVEESSEGERKSPNREVGSEGEEDEDDPDEGSNPSAKLKERMQKLLIENAKAEEEKQNLIQNAEQILKVLQDQPNKKQTSTEAKGGEEEATEQAGINRLLESIRNRNKPINEVEWLKKISEVENRKSERKDSILESLEGVFGKFSEKKKVTLNESQSESGEWSAENSEDEDSDQPSSADSEHDSDGSGDSTDSSSSSESSSGSSSEELSSDEPENLDKDSSS